VAKTDLAMHRLLGEHKWVKKGLKSVCSICGIESGTKEPFNPYAGLGIGLDSSTGQAVSMGSGGTLTLKKLEKAIDNLRNAKY